MPIIISVLLGGLLSLVSSFVGRVLLALGLGFVEFAGLSALFDYIKRDADGMLAGFAGSSLVEWAGFFRIDVHISIILSAIGVRMTLNMLQGGSIRRLVRTG